jgi:hypothetical protein
LVGWLDGCLVRWLVGCLNGSLKRPKFGNGPLVRHPLSELLKNHISAWAEVSDLLQKGERLYIFFCTNKKINIWGSPYTLYDLQQLGPCMSKLGFEKGGYVLFCKYFGGSSE